MHELSFCFGNSRNSVVWHPGTMTYDELCERLKTPLRTPETVEQYHKMSKDEKKEIKDKGGFVAGTLKGTRRKKSEVISRSMATIDGDNLKPSFFPEYRKKHKYKSMLYTTHTHLPDAPRVRLLIPFTRDVTPEEYNAIVRYLAKEIGMDKVDPCSFMVNQMMYWPTCPSDGEYICECYDGEDLDPDVFLAAYPNWQSYDALPYHASENRKREYKKQEDPLTKEGLVGAFCRTYSIQDAIRKFLNGIYEETTDPNRWTYIQGESTAGLVIYEDKFAYSHHATDPANGKLLNAFDIVRVHKFQSDDEKTAFIKMCGLAESDEKVSALLKQEKAEQAKADFKEISSSWDEPIPFGKYELDRFPVEALPLNIGEYVKAVAESTQTPIDMAGTAALALISVCIQGKYCIRGKADWTEPLNLFANIIASPSERKSAVLHAVTNPLDDYETRFNMRNAAHVEANKMRRRILERRQKAIEDKVAKGNAEEGELERIAQEIADFVEETPLHLYVDDITTEKLVSVMSSNGGRAALISSEGGIFDTLAGIYTKNVNIDVMLKGYSGDTIRVDRIGRDSESIMNPALTLLLMTQPKVISDVLGNATFRGRGLTARFLYCLPTTSVGNRRFQSKPVPDELYKKYEDTMVNMLREDYPNKPEVITLSREASNLLTAFAEEVEPKLKKEYAEIADWCGKLVGNVLRISGLLCRAGVFRSTEFLSVNDELTVNGDVMENAIKLGRYYLSHAMAVYDVIPELDMYKKAKRLLEMIKEKHMTEFTRRTAMRFCQYFKTVASIQPVLDFLEDYGYVARLPEEAVKTGRPPLPQYMVNPSLLSD